MSLVKIRRAAQITLPSDIRQALGVKEGDYLEAELVEGGVMLRPVAVVDREMARRRLIEMLDETRGGSRYVGGGPEPSDDDLMRTVVDEIKTRESRERRS
jgi:AbrB family looped-hinge helix DNA binding protein